MSEFLHESYELKLRSRQSSTCSGSSHNETRPKVAHKVPNRELRSLLTAPLHQPLSELFVARYVPFRAVGTEKWKDKTSPKEHPFHFSGDRP